MLKKLFKKKGPSFVLYLEDEATAVYKNGNCLSRIPKKDFSSSLPFFEEYLSPGNTECLVIELQQQDIHEEKLPPLLPWDYFYFTFHKRAAYLALGGGYIGFSLFKQDKEKYLQTIHIPPIHPLYAWISWVRTRSGKVFFLPLEARKFLKTYSDSSKPYKMLSCSLPNKHIRQLIFKGKRLLLSRICRKDDDQKSSLHFLSRNFPDINEKIDTLNCNLNEVIDFITHKNKASLFLINLSFKKEYFYLNIKIFFVVSIIFWAAVEIYYGFSFKHRRQAFLQELSLLRTTCDTVKKKISGKNIPFLRKALDHYTHVKAATRSPLQDFINVEKVLRNKNLSLQKIVWKHTLGTEIILTFLLKPDSPSVLAHSFENALLSFQTFFSTAHIQILTGPYKSAPHETFPQREEGNFPLASIKVTLP